MKSRTNFIKKAGLTAAHLAISATALAGGGNTYYRAQRGLYNPGSAITADMNLKPLASTSIKGFEKKGEMEPSVIAQGTEFELKKTQQTRELIIVDSAVEDKSVIFKQAQPGVDIVEIPQGKDGMVELMKILSNYTNLDAVHFVSHAEKGAIYIGGQRIDQKVLEQDVAGFVAINSAIREGGDLMIYGCDVAQGQEGNDFLEIIQNNTHVDVAASNDQTGNEAYGGNWDLEIRKGDIEATPLPESIAMKDFTGTLQFSGTIDFSQTKDAGDYYGDATINAEVWTSPSQEYALEIDGKDRATDLYTGSRSNGQAAYTGNTETAVTLRFSNDVPFSPQNIKIDNIFSDGSGRTYTFNFSSDKGDNKDIVFNQSEAKTVDLSDFADDITALTISSSRIYVNIDDFQVENVGGSSNNPPTDITVSSLDVNQSSGINAVVGTLSTIDADMGDTHVYSLVAGSDDDNNGSFNISGSDLRANDASALAAGEYSVRIQTDDGTDTYSEAFTISVVDDIAPSFLSSTPSLSGTTGSQTTLTVQLNEIGTAYFVVVAEGDGIPGSAQVKAGQNSGGGAALASGSINVSMAAQDFTDDITGLTSSTAYDIYVVADDEEGNLQDNPEGLNVETLSTPAFTSTPVTEVDYEQLYSYSILATQEEELGTTFSAPTLPAWLTLSTEGQSESTEIGSIPDGTYIIGVAGDDNGNIYAATSDGTSIYKIEPDGNTTQWTTGLSSGNVYALHVAGNYLYIPRYYNENESITRVALDDPEAGEELFASFYGGALSLTDHDDWIYAANYVNSEIKRIHKSDQTVETILTSADGIPTSGPFGLVFDDEDNLYIATYGNRSILKYDGSSVTTVVSELPNNVTSVKTDKSGNFYISMANGGTRRYDSEWNDFTYVSPGENDNIWSISFTNTGTLVYGLFNTNQVYSLQTGAILTGTPARTDIGDHPVVLEASNSAGSTQQSFSIDVQDNTGPVVETYSPAHNATDVALEPTLSLAFDEEITLGNEGSFIIKDGSTEVLNYDLSITEDRNQFSLSGDNKTLEISINNPLPNNTGLSIEIQNGSTGNIFEDLHGNAFEGYLASSNTWTFTTIANQPPVSSNVAVSGDLQYDRELTGEYDYSDAEDDAESGSTYQWYRADDSNGSGRSAISAADEITYTLSKDDIGKFISFEVTPNDGTDAGTAVESTFNGPVASPFADGEGTEANPYEIATAEQLDVVRDFLDNHFTQIADIDLGTSPWSDGAGWNPIGDNGNEFTGSFDGNGHVIINLYIDRSSDNSVGLIGVNKGRLANVNLSSVNLSGQSVVGALVGNNYTDGIIINSSSSGDINADNTAGGLVGQNSGTIDHASSSVNIVGGGSIGGLAGINGYDAAKITNSHASGNVTGVDHASGIGGLVGSNRGSQITNSYATGKITGTSSVGGFLGNNRDNGAIIENSYATGNVETFGDEMDIYNIGGFAGSNRFSGEIKKSFSAGEVTSASGSNIGGFTGNNEATVSNSFWDVDATRQNTSDGGTGKSTHEMKDKSTFTDAGWDFDAVWQIDEPTGGSISYPYLQNNAQDPVPGYLVVSAPTVITDATLTNITSGSVDVAGEVTGDGSLEITQRGFTWATAGNPSDTTIVWAGSGTGSYSATVNGLPPGTELTIRAIAVNHADSAFGDPISFETDKGELLVDGSFTAADKEYDGESDAEFDQNSLSLDGIYSGHEVQLGNITLEFADADAGEDKDVTLQSATLTGDDAGKYAVSLTNAPTTMADITPRALTLTADAQQVVYGEADPVLGYEITSGSLVTGEELSGSLERVSGNDVGTYAIQQGNLHTGANYDLSFISADFEITPRTLSITAETDQSKTYGENDPSFGFEAENFGWNDDKSVLSGSLSRDTGEDVGNYTINQGDLDAGDNYTIDYSGADFEIKTKNLLVEADADQSKEYGETDPAFTYTVNGFELGDDEQILSGSLDRQTGEDAGAYAITEGDLSAGNNYQISFTGAEFDIFPAELTISAVENQSKIYGESDPGYAWSADGFQFSDDEQIVSGELTRESGDDTGQYELSIGSLEAGDNYTVSYTPASFLITPATLLVNADEGQWKFEGDADPELTFTADGFAFDDDESVFDGAPDRDQGDAPGDYTILKGSLSAGTNYKIDFTGTDFSILRTPPVVKNRTPGDDEERIAVDAAITAEFDHDISIANDALITLTSAGGEAISVEAETDGTALTLKHGGLSHHTEYTASIGEGALENVDEIGNKAAEWSFTTIMSPPMAESFSPEDGATHVGVNEPLAIAFSQEISIADASGITIESESGVLPAEISAELMDNTLTITHSGLENLSDYTVTVPSGTVQNADGVGNESTSWSFTSIVPVPEPVVLAVPANREGTVALDAGFEWESTPHAVYYRVQVSDSETFETLVAEADELSEISFVPDEMLTDYSTYFWRVKASNDAGESEWSDVHRFTTVADIPGAVFPLINAENISIAPMLEWSSEYQTTYRVQLAGSDDFESPVADSLTINDAVQLMSLEEDKPYFWRVRVETDSTTSKWSESIQFRTRQAASAEDDEQIVDYNVSFGETSNSDAREISEMDYRMVGLPGNDHLEVEDFFEGKKYGRNWKVFYENGADTEYYDEYIPGDERFVFAPGRGFWVLSTEIMNLELNISSVKTNGRDAYSVTLHPGWNIIANPHRGPVSWSDVQEMNDFSGDAWSYDQRFALADSLHPVQGYYVYNHPDQPREFLDIPYATMEQRRSEERGKSLLAAKSTAIVPSINLSAQFKDEKDLRFDTQILFPDLTGSESDEEKEIDEEKLRRYYPSLEMSRSGMMLVNNEHLTRGGLLREVGRFDAEGAEFELHLKGKMGQRFSWNLNMQQLPEQTRALIVNKANSKTWLLKHGEEMETSLTEPNAVYDLYTGDQDRLEQLQNELMPQEFALEPNYPNPFNPMTNIRYSLPTQQHVKLEVYDVIGRRVQILTNDVQQAGWHVVQFDAGSLASGVYLYRLTTDNNVKVRKMTLVK